MAYHFRPPLWSILPMLACMGLFLSLGTWQVQRGLSKTELESAFQPDVRQVPMTLDSRSTKPDPLAAPLAEARGGYAPELQVLLDHQTRERVPGYRVWTPLRIADGGLVMVDRGWVPANPDRRQLPDLAVSDEPRRVRGYWRPLPEPGLRLGVQSCQPGTFPRVLSYPTVTELECLLGAPVADGLLLLDAGESQGFVREWELPNPVPPARHYAYAAQWYAFAATLLFLFIKLNLKRQS